MKNTSITDKDTIKVSVDYRYIVLTRMLYKDYLGLKKIEDQQLYTIQSQDKQISSLLKQTEKYGENDSIAKVIIKNDSILINDFRKKYMANKRIKTGMYVSIPVVAVLSFLFGWYLHK